MGGWVKDEFRALTRGHKCSASVRVGNVVPIWLNCRQVPMDAITGESVPTDWVHVAWCVRRCRVHMCEQMPVASGVLPDVRVLPHQTHPWPRRRRMGLGNAHRVGPRARKRRRRAHKPRAHKHDGTVGGDTWCWVVARKGQGHRRPRSVWTRCLVQRTAARNTGAACSLVEGAAGTCEVPAGVCDSCCVRGCLDPRVPARVGHACRGCKQFDLVGGPALGIEGKLLARWISSALCGSVSDTRSQRCPPCRRIVVGAAGVRKHRFSNGRAAIDRPWRRGRSPACAGHARVPGDGAIRRTRRGRGDTVRRTTGAVGWIGHVSRSNVEQPPGSLRVHNHLRVG
eukprot:m.213145 g.213145  ORF g.213145 m.213145 type:complete len:340 (-) comp26395_c0_seq1:2-1021(-)